MGLDRDTIKQFFFPSESVPIWRRAAPYALLGFLTIIALVSGVYTWEKTNSPEFCGTACHTMPPEYTSYLVSPHARVDCVECHIGRGFFATRITRKAGDIRHIFSLLFKRYEYPINAYELRPARDTCEKCHSPEKFSDDSLREIKHFGTDKNNTPSSIYLIMKTGGGVQREGLGRGIHWHIQNKVSYLSLDPEDQQIPYIRVVNTDGTVSEYIDINHPINPDQIAETDLEDMDCITCHNRITHLVMKPEDSVDQLLTRKQISINIPEIRLKAVEVLRANYRDSVEIAMNGIEGLTGYYKVYYPDFYTENKQLVDEAILALQNVYRSSVFPLQKLNWDTHPNNLGHQTEPGCFRCHDGKHMNAQGEAIRIECNLCHSIPVVVGPQDFVGRIEISRGSEPQSHLNANWITMHRDVFDYTCENCHTTGDAGGISNTSTCSNSACHGQKWVYAGFDAPGLREILIDQLPEPAKPIPTVSAGSPKTYTDSVQPIFQTRCGSCHGENGIQGLTLTSYEGLMAGSQNGPIIIAGDAENSLLIKKVAGAIPHFGQLNQEELTFIKDWIMAGAQK